MSSDDPAEKWRQLQGLEDLQPGDVVFDDTSHSSAQPRDGAATQYFVPAPSTSANIPAESPRVRPRVGDPAATQFHAEPRPHIGVPAEPSRRRRRRWYRPKLRWLFAYFPIVVLAALLAVCVWGWSRFNAIERVDLDGSLASAGGEVTNVLIVGSDSREGVDPSADDAGAIGNVAGQRSDTIIVVRVANNAITMMSIPRDLYLRNAKTGKMGRVNGAYESSAANLVRTIHDGLGIPIHRYMEVDFVSFESIVDAIGGVTVDFPNAVYDRHSGLNITTPGPHLLDGTDALAYVRSRHYTEIINGKPKTDPRADIGRQERQQQFIRALVADVGSIRNPLTAARVTSGAVSGVKLDTEFGFTDALTLARAFGSSDSRTLVLPTHATRRGGADVLELTQPEADAVLAQLR